MTKNIISFFMILTASSIVAQGLPLPGEAYRAKFERTICRSFEEADAGQPSAFIDRSTEFQYLASDAGLDNLKLSLTFIEGETKCLYDVLFTLETRANLGLYEDSKVVAISGQGSCSEGKAYFDSLMDYFPYFYDGSAGYTQIAFGFAVEGTSKVCGEDANQVLSVFGYQEQ